MRYIMVRYILRIIPFVLLLAIFVQSAHADVRYVSDTLIITMRSGKGNRYRIIKHLKTGTPLEVIEEDNEYLKVRTKGGETGWVLKQYLTKKIPKAKVITILRAETDRLKKDIQKMEDDNRALRQKRNIEQESYNKKVKELDISAKTAEEDITLVSRELKEVSEKYNTLLKQSKSIVEMIKERDLLKKENSGLSDVNNKLQQENKSLRRKSIIYWFLAGGGVLFFGWIIGRMSRKKRYY